MNVGDWIGAIQAAAATAAIVGGAVWGYFRFAKGRTLKRRAELSVEGNLLEGGGKCGVRVRVLFRNMGLTKIPMGGVYVRTYGVWSPTWTKGDWKRIDTVRVLEDHEWIEPQEPVGDEVLISVDPAKPALAYRVDAVAFEAKKRFRRGRVQWTARQIFGGVLQPPQQEAVANALPTGTSGRRGLPVSAEEERRDESLVIGEQRSASEEDAERFEQEIQERQRRATEEEAQRIDEEAGGDQAGQPEEEAD